MSRVRLFYKGIIFCIFTPVVVFGFQPSVYSEGDVKVFGYSEGQKVVKICKPRYTPLKNKIRIEVEGFIVGRVSDLNVVVQTSNIRFIKPAMVVADKKITFGLFLKKDEAPFRVELLGDTGFGQKILYFFIMGHGGKSRSRFEELIKKMDSIKVTSRGEGSGDAMAFLNGINMVRKFLLKEKLQGSGKLAQAALLHNRDMRDGSFFGHRSPIRGGLKKRMMSQKIVRDSVGEVITVASDPYEALMNIVLSPSHLMVILKEDFNEIGVSVVRLSDGKKIFTAIMASSS